jgi:serine O-acetyltransferase
MICSKKDLKEYINADNSYSDYKGFKSKLIQKFCDYPSYELKKFLIFLRKQEYYINTAHGNKIKGFMGLYFERKKNKLGLRLGIEIAPNSFGKGLQIYHGNIVINNNVKAGENCKLHGFNCIGNNGKTGDAPILGDNIDLGVGAVIIGNVSIANNVTIGANAVVNRSITDENSTYAGIPAKKIH